MYRLSISKRSLKDIAPFPPFIQIGFIWMLILKIMIKSLKSFQVIDNIIFILIQLDLNEFPFYARSGNISTWSLLLIIRFDILIGDIHDIIITHIWSSNPKYWTYPSIFPSFHSAFINDLKTAVKCCPICTF